MVHIILRYRLKLIEFVLDCLCGYALNSNLQLLTFECLARVMLMFLLEKKLELFDVLNVLTYSKFHSKRPHCLYVLSANTSFFT